MADETPNQNTAEQSTAPSVSVAEGRILRLVHWASGSKLRMGLVGSLFIAIFGGVFAVWSYLAHLAVSGEDRYTLARALVALDERNYEEAKNIVGEMQRRGSDSEEFGGALYVLGAVKAAMAELEWSKDRQRAMHLVAARYLQKARELGVPKRLENPALFLVGQSLIRGNQPAEGIEVLKSALADESLPTTKIHGLLAEAYRTTAEPNLAAALQHNRAVLDDPDLDQSRRNAASITHADILGKMGRLEEARQYLEMTGSSDAQQARIKSISGRLAIAQARQLPMGSEPRRALANQALAELREAQRLDPLSSELTRQAMYWIGKGYEVLGDDAAATAQYDQLGKSYGDTPESVAAMLAKADLARAADDTEHALAGYRSVLSSVGDPRHLRQ